MNILGMYKELNLVKKDHTCYVVDRQERKILYHGDEESCTRVFITMIAGFIEKDFTEKAPL